MGTFNFQLKYDQDLSRLGEIQARMKDFSIPFGDIIDKWAESNSRKFEAGRGAELSGTGGADLRPAVWEPLQSLPYVRSKRRRGFADWLMVGTGALMSALTNRGNFGEFIDTHRVAFGVPLDEEDAVKAVNKRNATLRPTIFLSLPDRNMIKAVLKDYISMSDNYRGFLMSSTDRILGLRKEMKQMNLEFAEVSGE